MSLGRKSAANSNSFRRGGRTRPQSRRMVRGGAMGHGVGPHCSGPCIKAFGPSGCADGCECNPIMQQCVPIKPARALARGRGRGRMSPQGNQPAHGRANLNRLRRRGQAPLGGRGGYRGGGRVNPRRMSRGGRMRRR